MISRRMQKIAEQFLGRGPALVDRAYRCQTIRITSAGVISRLHSQNRNKKPVNCFGAERYLANELQKNATAKS